MGLEEKARQLAAQQQAEEPIDWNAEREWWLKQLSELHATIRSWLSSLEAKSLVKISETPMRMSEEHVGVYTANLLVLTFADQAIVLEPHGTLIVGARGRVDVYRRGSRATAPAMLILNGPKASPEWKIWPNRDPSARQAFTKDTFEKLLESLL